MTGQQIDPILKDRSSDFAEDEWKNLDHGREGNL